MFEHLLIKQPPFDQIRGAPNPRCSDSASYKLRLNHLVDQKSVRGTPRRRRLAEARIAPPSCPRGPPPPSCPYPCAPGSETPRCPFWAWFKRDEQKNTDGGVCFKGHSLGELEGKSRGKLYFCLLQRKSCRPSRETHPHTSEYGCLFLRSPEGELIGEGPSPGADA